MVTSGVALRASQRRVFFLPGASGDGRFWHPLGGHLPDTWDRVYFDWPGLGVVPPSDHVRGFEDLVRMVLARLDAPADLVAQSMGGVVALRVAIERPERVRRLVLVATSGGLDTTRFGARDWREDYVREYPDARRWIVEQRPDLTTSLPSIQTPALLVWGDADPISPVAVGSYLARTLPRADLVVIPGGGHALARDRAADVAPHVGTWLAASASSR